MTEVKILEISGSSRKGATEHCVHEALRAAVTLPGVRGHGSGWHYARSNRFDLGQKAHLLAAGTAKARMINIDFGQPDWVTVRALPVAKEVLHRLTINLERG